METIKKEDLIENEIYVFGDNYINKIGTGNLDIKFWISIDSSDFSKTHVINNHSTIRNATSQEKHWLNVCIDADEFISYDEAIKTFIPEYVECIEKAPYNCYGEPGKVYKVEDWNYSINDCWLKGTTSGSTDKNRFKPSTKEAYDAQFVVKEPEFILPKKWFIKTNLDNINVIGNWFNKNKQNSIRDYSSLNKDNTTPVYSELCFPGVFHCDEIFHGLSSRIRGNDYVEITFKQFKQYVLKEPVTEKIIEPLSEFKVIETIETITKVENNEGNQFFIGDKITTSLNNIIRTISSFTYNEDKTQLYANFKETLDVVNINLIEHYIILKVDFVLPKKWCIRQSRKEINDWLNLNKTNGFTYISTSGSNIVHFPAPVINNRLLYSSVQNGYTEITFEQFEKYVLNKTVK